MDQLPFDFWQTERRYLAAVIKPRIQAMALAGATDAIGKLSGIGLYVDDDLINEAAANWARQHTDEIINQLSGTSQKVIGEVISNWIETPGANMGDLETALKPLLDDNIVRASRVAVTETTRAYSEGFDLAHQQAGIPKAIYKPPAHVNCYCQLVARRNGDGTWVQTWETQKDEKVCKQPLQTPWGVKDGCLELDGLIVSEGDNAGEYYR